MSEMDRLNVPGVLPPTFTIVPAAELSDLRRRLEHAIVLMETAPAQFPVDSERDAGYVEPGPHGPRKWFEVKELLTRWGWKKSKLYAVTQHELPYWTHGGTGRQYFWAYVWAFEQRISREEADKLFRAADEVSHAIQARPRVLHPGKGLARVR